MSITLRCRCGKQVPVAEGMAGRRVRCPACGKALAVPDGEEPITAAPPPLAANEREAAAPNFAAHFVIAAGFLVVGLGVGYVLPHSRSAARPVETESAASTPTQVANGGAVAENPAEKVEDKPEPVKADGEPAKPPVVPERSPPAPVKPPVVPEQSPPPPSPVRPLAFKRGAPPTVGLAGLPLPRGLGQLTVVPRALSPDGQWLATVQDRTIHLVRTKDGTTAHKLTGHQGYLAFVLFSPDSKHLVSNASLEPMKLWEVSTGKEVRTLAQPSEYFNAMLYGPDGASVLGLSTSRKVWFFPTDGGRPRDFPLQTTQSPTRMVLSPDGKSLLVSGEREVELFDATTLASQATRLAQPNASLSSGRDGQLVGWTPSYFGATTKVRVWKLPGKEPVRELPTLPSGVTGACFANGGKHVVVWSAQGTDAVVHDAATGEAVLTLQHPSTLMWVDCAPGSKTVYTYAGGLRAWDLSILDDPTKRATLKAYIDGEKENYAGLVRLLFPAGGKSEVKLRGETPGRIRFKVATKAGLSVELGDATFFGAGAFARTFNLTSGAINISVDAKKVKAIDLLEATAAQQTARVRLHLTDGTAPQEGTMYIPSLEGRGEFGHVRFATPEVRRLELDFRDIDKKELPAPPVEAPGPCPAQITDEDGLRYTVTDIKPPTRFGAVGNVATLPLYADGAHWQLDIRQVKRFEVLLAPRGGVIARAELIGGEKLVGYVRNSEVYAWSCYLGKASFSLNLGQVRRIDFE